MGIKVGVGIGVGVGVGIGVGVGSGVGVGVGIGVGVGVGLGVGVDMVVGVGVCCEQETPHEGVVGCTYAVGERPGFWGVVVAVGEVCWTDEADVVGMLPKPDGDEGTVCVGLVAVATGSRCKVVLIIRALKQKIRTTEAARAIMANFLEMDGRTGGGGGRGIVG